MPMRWRKNISHDSSSYSLGSFYFITICTAQKLCRFGHVQGDLTVLSGIGNTIKTVFEYLNQQTKMPVIHDFVIMPNHVHFVVDLSDCGTQRVSDTVRDFKSYTTREFCKPHGDQLIPLWQRGYHEHRIRNQEEMAAIVDYIRNNPARWAHDKFYVT